MVDVGRERAGQRPERHDERVDAHVDELLGRFDHLVGVLAEPDQQVGRDLVVAEDPHGLAPGGAVLVERHRGLARHPAPAHVVVHRLDVDADRAGARLVEVGDGLQVGRRLALHLDREVGKHLPYCPHAPCQVGGAPVASVRRARRHDHLRDAVEVVRGLGHLGDLRGCLDRDRRARLERLLDRAEPAPLGLVVAHARLHDGRREDVGRVQPGDLLVGDAVSGLEVVELRAAHRLHAEAGVGPVEEQAPPVDRERAVGVDRDRGPDPPEQHVTVVARSRARLPADRRIEQSDALDGDVDSSAGAGGRGAAAGRVHVVSSVPGGVGRGDQRL